MTGSPTMVVGWSALVIAGLLAWVWLVSVVATWRPRWFGELAVCDLPAWRRAIRATAPPSWPLALAWWALAVLAGWCPLANGMVTADLDAGLLWILVFAVINGWALRRRGWRAPGRPVPCSCWLRQPCPW